MESEVGWFRHNFPSRSVRLNGGFHAEASVNERNLGWMRTRTVIDITLNGESRTLDADASMSDVLRSMDLDPSKPKGIAVAVNDEVVSKGEWPSVTLEDGDRVEVITARQGG